MTELTVPATQQPSELEKALQKSLETVAEKPFKLTTTKDLAKALGMKTGQQLTYIWKNKSSHYSIRKMPKRSKGLRTLHIPDNFLRQAQNAILNRVLDKIPCPDYLWAFEKGKNVADMSNVHAGKEVVISIDLKDYFGKVHVKHILPLLEGYGIQGLAGRLVAELVTYKFFLPQGGITSPKVSNLVAGHTFGPKIKAYCDSEGLALTIYADDVTVSYDGQKDVSAILGTLAKLLRENGGFLINNDKTKVMYHNHRQVVCGVVVNEKPNLAREERNRLRAIVHNIEVHGVKKEAEKNELGEEEFVASIRGRLNWYRQLNPKRAENLFKRFTKAVTPKPAESVVKVLVAERAA